MRTLVNMFDYFAAIQHVSTNNRLLNKSPSEVRKVLDLCIEEAVYEAIRSVDECGFCATGGFRVTAEHDGNDVVVEIYVRPSFAVGAHEPWRKRDAGE